MPTAKKGFSESLLEYGKIRSFADEAVLSPEAAEPVCSSEPPLPLSLRQAEKIHTAESKRHIAENIFFFTVALSF